MLKPRNRLLNLRLTEDEFLELNQACLACGSRGLSDFARSAILECARRANPPHATHGAAEEVSAAPKANWMDDRLTSLNSTGRHLVEAVNALATQFAALQHTGEPKD